MESRIAHLRSQIGDYKVNTPLERDAEALQTKVRVLLGSEAADILFSDTTESTSARQLFFAYCENLLVNGRTQFKPSGKGPEADAISMRDFLGEKGIKLYKNALEEESNSAEFRAAVVLVGTQHVDGPRLKQRFIQVVGGVSGSGKSTGAASAAVAICDILKNVGPANQQGNDIVSVDGGIERQVSQMRGLLLQVAIANGYPGLDGLDGDDFKTSVKKIVEQAALASDQVSVKIPLTFADPRDIAKSSFSLLTSTTERYEQNNPDKAVVFCETLPAPGRSEEDYRATVKRMGDQRAWLSEYGFEVGERFEIKMNNYDIGCESKRYEPQFFDWGLRGTTAERERYLSSSRDKIYIKIVNDLMYVYPDPEHGRWVRCDLSYKGNASKISERDFNAWQQAKLSNEAGTPDLFQWLDQRRKEGNAAPIWIMSDVRGNEHKFDEEALLARCQALSKEAQDLCSPNSSNARSSGRFSGFFDSTLTRSRSGSTAGRGSFAEPESIRGMLKQKLANLSRSSSSSLVQGESGSSSANSSFIESQLVEPKEALIDKFNTLVEDISRSNLGVDVKTALLNKVGNQLVMLCKVTRGEESEEMANKSEANLRARAAGVAKAIESITGIAVFPKSSAREVDLKSLVEISELIQERMRKEAHNQDDIYKAKTWFKLLEKAEGSPLDRLTAYQLLQRLVALCPPDDKFQTQIGAKIAEIEKLAQRPNSKVTEDSSVLIARQLPPVRPRRGAGPPPLVMDQEPQSPEARRDPSQPPRKKLPQVPGGDGPVEPPQAQKAESSRPASKALSPSPDAPPPAANLAAGPVRPTRAARQLPPDPPTVAKPEGGSSDESPAPTRRRGGASSGKG